MENDAAPVPSVMGEAEVEVEYRGVPRAVILVSCHALKSRRSQLGIVGRLLARLSNEPDSKPNVLAGPSLSPE